MENKLIPMTDFCLNLLNQNPPYNEVKMLTQISNYANFLKQPLTLGMFVPVDPKGNVLKEPRMIERTIGFDEKDVFWDIDEVEIYRKAKEKVLFEFDFVNPQDLMDRFSTIEELAFYYEPELTPYALKQLGLNLENTIS